MTKLHRPVLVLAIVILVIMGLNISNQGINSLTLETRKPVVGLQTQGPDVNIFAMGATHSYDKKEIYQGIILVRQQVVADAKSILNYLRRIVNILRVLLFS